MSVTWRTLWKTSKCSWYSVSLSPTHRQRLRLVFTQFTSMQGCEVKMKIGAQDEEQLVLQQSYHEFVLKVALSDAPNSNFVKLIFCFSSLGLVLWLCVRSVVIRSPLSCWSASCPSSAWWEKSPRTSRLICVSRAQPSELCRSVLKSIPHYQVIVSLLVFISESQVYINIIFYLTKPWI